ncbi:hypothetical protein ACFJGW_00565 [Burkholderiaceae bacterium UC74_6]
MAASFPPNVKYGWKDLQDDPASVVERSEMERGLPKQRRIASDVLMTTSITVYHNTKAEADAFEDWFYDDINAGQDWFDFTHPRRGTVIQVRIVGGKLGPLQYEQRTLEASHRQFSIEFLRSTW